MGDGQEGEYAMETTGLGPSSWGTGVTSSHPLLVIFSALCRGSEVWYIALVLLCGSRYTYQQFVGMQFTPQQLAGGGSYHPVTRIGNWREEISLAEAKLKEFRQNSAGGSLHLRKQQNKLSKCLQLVRALLLFFSSLSCRFLTATHRMD